MRLRYPRFIHAEFMTHRMFSRNASSSRAIPVERMIEDIRTDTAMPLHWGKNQKGMQATEECDELVDCGVRREFTTREGAWLLARDNAIAMAENFHRSGYHKQIVNRLLEPFMHINVLVTATDYANFYELRDHPDAEPHICMLAQAMKKAQAESIPDLLDFHEWHLPFVSEEMFGEIGLDLAKKVSVARCARVSYLTHDGRESELDEDVALFDRLVGSSPIHASPAEHQATPDQRYPMGWQQKHLHGNFHGWVQLRKTMRDEYVYEKPTMDITAEETRAEATS